MRRKLPQTTDATIEDVRTSVTARPKAKSPKSATSKPDGPLKPSAKRRAAPKPKVSAPPPESSVPERDVPVVELPPPTGPEAALRRARAREVVERFSAYSAVGCVVPIPLFEMATLGGLVYRMSRALAAHYAVELPRGRSRAVVAALVCALFPTEFGQLTTVMLRHVIPGANFVGFAVASVSAVALTRASGYALIHLFESGETTLPTSVAAWRMHLREVMA